MITFDWEAIYLTCFGVGLVLSLLAFFSGFGHLHFGHFRLHAGIIMAAQCIVERR